MKACLHFCLVLPILGMTSVSSPAKPPAESFIEAPIPADRRHVMPRGYLLRDEDTSPDKRFGVIYADAEVTDPAKARNFLVALDPFRILAENKGFAYFKEPGDPRAIAIEWTENTSAALVMVGEKWGTISATLFELKDGRVTRRTDLMAEVTKLLAAKFPKGKVKPYNDHLLFRIDGEDQWDFGKDGKQVEIHVSANTAPNLSPGLQWAGTLKGFWSVPEAKWLQQTTTGRIYRNEE